MDLIATHEAEAFLHARDLTSHIVNDLTALGYVGEDDNKLLTYLGAVSRKLDRPLGIIIQGSSSSGKTELQTKVLSLCPEEDVFYNTRTTPQSLYYLGLKDPYSLAHMVVAIEEAKGANEANYAIRVLLSRGRLDLQTTVSQTPVHIILYGPVAYLDTTTEDITNDETANRVLQIRTDASVAHTQAILEAHRRRAATVVGPSDQAIVARHQEAQRLLRPKAVIIPFAEHISFPTRHTRGRRDHQWLFDLICAITFLHQYQRRDGQAKGVDFVEAIPADHEMAAQLMERCLGYAFDDLSPKAKEMYVCVEQTMKEKQQLTVTRGDICRWTGWKRPQVRKQLKVITSLGYLQTLQGGQGQEYIYQLAAQAPVGLSWQLGRLDLDDTPVNGSPGSSDGNGHPGHPPTGDEPAIEAAVVHE
jgi:hypothetical protein